MRKSILLTAAVIAVLGAGSARASVILTTSSYSENFDDAKLGAQTADVWSTTAGTQAAVPGTSGWDGAKIAGSSSGGGTNNMDFLLNNGNLATGAIYTYGTTATTERALGMVASGTNTAAVGIELVNNTGATIDTVIITFVGEFWRSSTTSTNFLASAYSVGASGSTTYLSGAQNPASNLNLNGPAPVVTNGALDGNLGVNQTNVSSYLNGLNWANGDSLYLRWQDFDNVGNDAGLALDTFQLNVVPEPSTVVLGAMGLVGLAGFALRRGRK